MNPPVISIEQRLRTHGESARPEMRASRRSHGSALVIILSALILVSAIIVAYISQSTASRNVSFSSAGQYNADCAAQTGLDIIVADLRSEIVAGSTASTSGSVSIYQPNSNFTAVPFRVGDGGFANVIKRSASGSPFWSGTAYKTTLTAPTRALGASSTGSASANGRFIAADRWNAPYLLSGSSVPSGFVAPDWIIITREGAVSGTLPSLAELANKDVSNTKFAVGRFAYMIYDEGGLLDVNVAGYPSGSALDFTARRGTLPQVGLENIPGMTATTASALVNWRNQSSVSNYTNYVLSNTTGFASVASGDQLFVSRQDLITYAKKNQLSTDSLPYLGTFTRELNAPSFTPVYSSTVQSGYSANGQDANINPSLINTRVTKSFTRASDATLAQKDEPILKYRFPLSRLALITDSAVASGTDTDIYKYFGLQRSDATQPWVYRSGTSQIMTLSQIASAGREPDFFELLQAGINVGSVGQGVKSAISRGVNSSKKSPLDTNTYYQIIQIAANLIDQYDRDSYPTWICFDDTDFYGIENLPYIERVWETSYPIPASSSGSTTYGIWYQPQVWNPHNQSVGTGGTRPTQFAFCCSGSAVVTLQIGTTTGTTSTVYRDLQTSGTITFNDSSAFSSPTYLNSSNASGGEVVYNNNIGIRINTVTIPNPLPSGSYKLSANPTSVTHRLFYSKNGAWYPYCEIKNVHAGGTTRDPNASYANSVFQLRADPRTDRFGVFESFLKTGETMTQTIRPGTGNGESIPQNGGGFYSGGSDGWSNTASDGNPYMGCLSDNKGDLKYADPDGVTRLADGAYTNGDLSSGGYPLSNGASSLPVILNRAFRSVAEMGYAFRDQPWKHIDFFTANSGDATLLDLFCLNESPRPTNTAVSTDPPPIAGRLNLNTRQHDVLKAILKGVIKTEETADTVADADADTLAGTLITLTSSSTTLKGPLLNRADLVTKWIGDTSIIPASSQDSIIKRRREAAIRALADIGNTRTWNLLIDVIAQSGRYTTNAGSLDRFNVVGEKRYWLHVAIDRYTGKVISKYLEPVYE
ncbi:MAG: hypothetical protein ACFUZC_11210 [Chthoniobacteraceae bacterium]